MTAEEWKTVATVAGPSLAVLALVVSLFAFAQARKAMRAQTFLTVLARKIEAHHRNDR